MRQAEILEAGASACRLGEAPSSLSAKLPWGFSGSTAAASGAGSFAAVVSAPEARSAASGSADFFASATSALFEPANPFASVATFAAVAFVTAPGALTGPGCSLSAFFATEARSSAVSMSATACLQLLTTGQVHRAAKAAEPARGGKNRIVTS